MDIEYITEGYTLMMEYLKENKLLTKERNFRRKLERFYNKHKDHELLSVKEELRYLKLEKYFYNNILEADNSQDQALVNFLNIITSVDELKED